MYSETLVKLLILVASAAFLGFFFLGFWRGFALRPKDRDEQAPPSIGT